MSGAAILDEAGRNPDIGFYRGGVPSPRIGVKHHAILRQRA